jgi:hypothetical protein
VHRYHYRLPADHRGERRSPLAVPMTDLSDKLKIEFSDPQFFSIPLKKVEIETVPATGRTYFIHQGKIVAVARRQETPA